jgi:glycine/D-amino acid oxidase-like deaminating enzyme
MKVPPGHVVVVGGGVFGAASALELRRRAWEVTLLDPYRPPHESASSADVSKLVRMDYGADVFYHELAELALEGWDRWNADWPRPLYHEVGLLVLTRSAMAPGRAEQESLRVLRQRGYEVERVGPAALRQRFPAWVDQVDGYFNPRAGWVESTAVVKRLVTLGEEAGVVVRFASVAALLDSGSRVRGVRTSAGDDLAADRVVVCAGAWTPTLLPWLADRLRATAQPVLYFQAEDPGAFSGPTFPTWTADITSTGWYGFPALPDGRVKIGHHGPGTVVPPDGRGKVADAHVAAARAFLRDALPALADARLAGRRVCLYCDTSDGDFLIDAEPGRDGLIVASGGSGHGFKFAPVLGGIVADVVEGRANAWRPRFAWRAAGQRRTEAMRFSGT